MATTLNATVGGGSIRNTDGKRFDLFQVGEFNGGSILARGLVKHDLSSLAGHSIASATLLMTDDGTDLTDNTRTMRVYRLKRAWTTNVSWTTYDGSNNWQAAGGFGADDCEQTDIGSISMPNPPSSGVISISLTPGAIQEMANGTFANNGFLIKMDTETNDMHSFTLGAATNVNQLVIVTSGAIMFGTNF